MSPTVKQAEEELDKALEIILQDHESPCPVTSEDDRNEFFTAEESLRKLLKDTMQSDSSSWWGIKLLQGPLPSPQAVKCLKSVQGFHQRVKEEITSKRRARAGRKSNPPLASPSWHLDLGGVGSHGPHNPRPPSIGITPSQAEALSPLSESANAVNSPGQRHGILRSPPSPPLLQMSLNESQHYSEITRPSSSVMRLPPDLPELSGPPHHGWPTDVPFISSVPAPPDQFPSMSKFVPAYSAVAKSTSRQEQGWVRAPPDEPVSKINCLDVTSSNADGITLNNGGSNNSGAVIHKATTPPYAMPRRAPGT